MNLKDDTIAAVITPSGTGAVSVIRLSGNDAFSVIDSIFRGKSLISGAKSHTVHYGKIQKDSEEIDDVLVSVFRGPNSYTGEDVIEISFHGSPYISKWIMKFLFAGGVRNAEPGEFTKRAFLNNKIDLAQAEAVADLIASRTMVSHKGARNQLDGLLSSKVEKLREELMNLASFVEIELDFAEEDIEFVQKDVLLKRIRNISGEIENLLKSYNFGRVLKDGVNVALVGAPNVGKSSLMNYILKESRAIVSKIPGTTRDVIREDVSINGVLFKLFDTAGIRISEDEIEKEGVTRSKEAVKNADLILFIGDTEQGFSDEIQNELETVSGKTAIRVLNKIDLENKVKGNSDIQISALTGEGISELFDKMISLVFGKETYTEQDIVVSNTRHYNCLKNAERALDEAFKSSEKHMSGEFIATDIRSAIDQLSEIVGRISSEEILNNIFSKFCIGK
jgi:tRNA modification GTPase